MMVDTGRVPSGQALAVPVEPVSRLDPAGFDPSRGAKWCIAGNWPHFDVEPTEGPEHNYLGGANDAAVNGVYPSKLAALEHLIHSLEETRAQLAEQIARHKRARRNAIAMEARQGGDAKQAPSRSDDSAGRKASPKGCGPKEVA